MGWEGLLGLFYLIVGDGDDEIDGGGRGGGGGGKWHFGTDQCTTGYQAEYVIQVQYEKTPCMMYVVREKIHLRGPGGHSYPQQQNYTVGPG